MILEELASICHEIRLLDKLYYIPPQVSLDNEFQRKLINDKQKKENDLSMLLYNTVKYYALHKEQK